MSTAVLFAQSLLIGLSIAAPVGPIGLLVIQRTLHVGRSAGLATGFGAAAADALYGGVGAFGVDVVIRTLQGARVPLALFGGALLLVLAWRTWTASPAVQEARVPAGTKGLAGAFAGTFVLTLSNPATIFSFIAVFASLGAHGPGGSPWPMVAGVLLGSALWWLVLSGAVGAVRERFDARWQRATARASALLLVAFALGQWAVLAA